MSSFSFLQTEYIVIIKTILSSKLAERLFHNIVSVNKRANKFLFVPISFLSYISLLISMKCQEKTITY